MKTRGAVQVHLIRDRFTIQLPCNSVGFQKQKNASLGDQLSFVVNLLVVR